MRGPTVADVGEHALIARLRARLPVAPADVIVGIGDDAAAVEPARGALEVLTTDTLVEGVHFDRRFSDPADVGHKALAVNVSDLAAMGAAPRWILLSVGLPDALPVEAFDGMLEGLLEEAARQRVALVGGNITRSPGPWFVDVTAIGTARRRRVLTRSGGRAGDELYVTGQLGAARAGLAWLQRGMKFDRVEFQYFPTGAETEIRPDRISGGVAWIQGGADTTEGQERTTAGAEDALADAVARYRRPAARVRAGVQVARNRAATACMDLSDGLADAVTQVAEASGTGAEVEAGAIPVHPAVPAIWPEASIHQALLGGDDYELLFAVPAKRRRAFLAAATRNGEGVPVTRIGRLTSPRDGLRLRRADGGEEPLPRGYEHFH